MEFIDEDGNVYRNGNYLVLDDDDDDDGPRNDYFEEAEDGYRNRRRRRGRRRRVSTARALVPRRVVAPVVAAPTPAPVVVQERRGFRDMPTGLLLDAIAQALTAIAPLPSPPPKTGVAECDLENIIEYMAASNNYYKRNEQIRVVGSLARLFV